ncbi:hypothetical protein UA08_01053 [Talaromyces atroroseus]|uniref:Zn(2)-C6 fungal-type domain-containing protein n=1 Tax=Talaromyces atroroseus TaxID=1441469 RepID=A0A225ASW9_TALAT|nr:hypothetical protein UA08_01053 [Talaromyces atroroseus]OKL64682.1 hypothetical protein UA08_01053 [Talaromyces atroroseus]
MVYCCKPSRGCGACRARKVKLAILTRFGQQCDQATPACKRCLKSNRICPGYRDQLSLLFRDESSAVAQKAKSAAAHRDKKNSNHYVPHSPGPSSSASTRSDAGTEFDLNTQTASLHSISPSDDAHYGFGDDGDDDDDDDDDDAQYASLNLVPLVSLSVDRRQQAICFCLSNFAWLNSSIHGFNIDADVSPTASMAEKAMMKGIVSVGMANISRRGPSSQSLKLRAQREYSNALKLTNAAISHPEQATDDATLTAVLCMSLFEIVTSRKPERIDAFVEHTKGAVALLQLRGEAQLVRSQGLEMFQFLRNEIYRIYNVKAIAHAYQKIVSCLMNYHRIPPALLLLSEKATMLPNAPYMAKISHLLCVIMARISEIRIEDLRSQRPSLDTSILTRAFAVDSQIETMMELSPSQILPQIYTSAPGQFFGNAEYIAPFEGVYHTYESFSSAMAANHFRYSRLLILEVIFNRYQRMASHRDFIPSPEFKDHCYWLRDLARALARDICATVPFFCGFIDASNPNLNGQKLVSTAGGMALLFPLYVAASVDGYGSARSHWIARCFNLIGREMGIDQALALMEILPVEHGMTGFIDSL